MRENLHLINGKRFSVKNPENMNTYLTCINPDTSEKVTICSCGSNQIKFNSAKYPTCVKCNKDLSNVVEYNRT